MRDARTSALKIHRRTQDLLKHSVGELPRDLADKLTAAAQRVGAAISAELPDDAALAFAALEERQQYQWQAVLDLQKRLAAAEQVLEGLRRKGDDLTLRSMARQTENKLYRYCRVPPSGRGPLTPCEVAQAGIERLEAEPHLQQKGTYKGLTKKFPNLSVGITELRGQGDGTAHQWLMQEPGMGDEHPVTRGDLQACIDRRHSDSVFKGDYETVLSCLVFLADKLQEPLFVPTAQDTPKQAPET